MKNLFDCLVKRSVRRQGRWGFMVLVAAVLLLSAFMIIGDAGYRFSSNSRLTSDFTLPAMTLSQLCSMADSTLRPLEMGLMNLTCATDLHGSENVDIHGALSELDRMARGVKTETERHDQKFRDRPQEFNGSEAYFRMLCLVTVLQQDFGVGYRWVIAGGWVVVDAKCGIPSNEWTLSAFIVTDWPHIGPNMEPSVMCIYTCNYNAARKASLPGHGNMLGVPPLQNEDNTSEEAGPPPILW